MDVIHVVAVSPEGMPQMTGVTNTFYVRGDYGSCLPRTASTIASGSWVLIRENTNRP